MSTDVYFYPVGELTHIGKHSVLKALERTFGEMPREFTRDDLELLDAMAAASTEPGYKLLADGVRQHGRVMIEVSV